MLRGVYFTSGTQEGTPIDRVMGALARTLRPRAHGSPRRGGARQELLPHRLLQRRGVRRAGPGGANRGWSAGAVRCALAGFAAITLVGAALIAGWALSYAPQQAYVAEVEAQLPELRKAVDEPAAGRRPAT